VIACAKVAVLFVLPKIWMEKAKEKMIYATLA